VTKEEKIHICESALDVAHQKLSDMTGDELASGAADHLLRVISGLQYAVWEVEEREKRSCDCECSCHKSDAPEQSYPTPGPNEADGDTETAAPVLDPAPSDLPKHPPTSEPAEITEPAMTFTEARTILGDLSGRYSHLDLESLLLRFGANKLSAIDPSKYAALVQAAKEAVGEA
jgi:hypothetical protein